MGNVFKYHSLLKWVCQSSSIENINLKNVKEETPLSLCLERENYIALQIILKYGAETNQLLKDNLHPLHYAISKKMTRIIILLIEFGSDLSHKNENNETAYDLLHELNDTSINNVLRPLLNKMTSSELDLLRILRGISFFIFFLFNLINFF